MEKKKAIDLPVTQLDDNSLDLKERLLPGIPDEVTLDLITPKLNWKSFLTLSSTCSAWRNAIRDHLVYDARVRSHSAETHVLVRTWSRDDGCGYLLYSFREKSSFRLPPLCGEDGRLMEGSCIALDGKLYAFEGLKRGNEGELLRTNKVHVLDLAGQRQWTQCASMQNARAEFGCGAIDGKIYVFGGASSDIHNGGAFNSWTFQFSHVTESEVYDPTVDAWSVIKHMPGGLRSQNVVTTAGDELLVHEGIKHFIAANDLMAYRPAIGNWKTLSQNVGFDRMEFNDPILQWDNLGFSMFVAHGKLHMMSASTIDVYDIESDSWTQLHSFSLGGFRDNERVFEVKPVDSELLAIVMLDFLSGDKCLVQSKGFGSGEKEIVWEKVPSTPHINSLICTVTL